MNDKPPTLFDYLDNILFRQSEIEYQKHINHSDFDSSFSNFMVLRYCTMTRSNQINAYIATQLINLELLKREILYRYLMTTLPKQPRHFIQYIK